MNEIPAVAATCDGGDLDCGSGLLLIIKKHMDAIQNGEILEVRSRERTVAEDLPAWCRMVQHEFLDSKKNKDDVSYFIRKGGADSSLQQDLEAARHYEWNVRVQAKEGLTANVYSRNHTFKAGQPADFSANVEAPSAIDYLLGSLGTCLIVGYKQHASRRGLTIDAMECSVKGKLDNVLYHMQLEDEGSPRLIEISGTFYVSSPEEAASLQETWELTLERSPIYQTLCQTVHMDIRFASVF